VLNEDILRILEQLNQDLPDFYALEGLSPSLATSIALWIKEDRINARRRPKKRNV